MGSQQLLLIAISIFIVAAMVIVGYNVFSVSFADQVKDLAIHKVTDIGTRANIYRMTALESGGGGGSYRGFDAQLNNLLREDQIVKKFSLTEDNNDIIIALTLINIDEDNNLFRVWAKYDSEGLKSLRVYEPDSENWVWVFKRRDNE